MDTIPNSATTMIEARIFIYYIYYILIVVHINRGHQLAPPDEEQISAILVAAPGEVIRFFYQSLP
ncbi:MAG: hypothetical protein A2Z49_08420 [Chloroflexi bacterium RBG_19FT_COMBO_56_12]|nr:MAG: hypothetical protein A2Z49_08420 [Chloroflexi bacterium RBG_19FT_COMBO_56_12]